MAEIRVLIVDDEPVARRGVRQLLAACDDIVVVGESRDGGEAVRDIEGLRPDLVFLDVRMPVVDGLQVVRAIGADRMPMTVFVTAFDEFAVDAFEANALDYLVKPLSESRFRATMEKVRKAMQVDDALALARRLAALLESSASAGEQAVPTGAGDAARPHSGAFQASIVVPVANGARRIDATEIDWIEARDDYVCIHTAESRYLLRDSISAVESRLDPQSFVRIHRSAIVRLDRVREWTGEDRGSGGRVILRNGTSLAVSRRRLAHVRSVLDPDRRRR